MAGQLLVLEMVPDFFVWIPIRRVLGKIEYVETRLLVDPSPCFLGRVRRCLIHHNDEVSAWMMSKHLVEELNHFLGRDAFLK